MERAGKGEPWMGWTEKASVGGWWGGGANHREIRAREELVPRPEWE